MTAFVYMVQCSDGSYYVGSSRTELEARIAEHNAGTYGGYTAQRLPVKLVYSQDFERIEDCIAAERQIKGWSRAKKEALIRGDLGSLEDWQNGTAPEGRISRKPKWEMVVS
ncbi:MAG: GIY-YIG nuclease family protein [Alphaproteobacteria bacterium]|nr:GIY-YIG nuclease family protein [Alphaproteobacteria bacterium]